MNLKLNFDFKKILPVLQKLQPYIFGVVLIGVFAYTSLVVNAAFHTEADPTISAAADPAAKISFDKATIESVKKLDVVQGNVPTGDLGKSDPFK
jgi:hypothetical protein